MFSRPGSHSCILSSSDEGHESSEVMTAVDVMAVAYQVARLEGAKSALQSPVPPRHRVHDNRYRRSQDFLPRPSSQQADVRHPRRTARHDADLRGGRPAVDTFHLSSVPPISENNAPLPAPMDGHLLVHERSVDGDVPRAERESTT